MIEQIQPYLIPTALFFLLFILTFWLFHRYEKSIQAFWVKQSWLWKIPWDPISKIICLWAGILLARKVIYCVPCQGIIQTTSSIWWMDTCVLTGLCFVFFLFLAAAVIIGIIFGFQANPSGRKELVVEQLLQLLGVLFALGIFFTLLISHDLSLNSMPLVQIMFTPLILLKMICTGKYLGLLTSLGVGYLIFNRFKKLKHGITRRNIKFLALPLLIIIVFLLFGYSHFTGDGRVMMIHKVETAKSREAFEDLVDAAHSIKDNHYKSSVLRVAAMEIAQHGDTSWATSIAKGIPDMRIRTSALEIIQQGVEKK